MTEHRFKIGDRVRNLRSDGGEVWIQGIAKNGYFVGTDSEGPGTGADAGGYYRLFLGFSDVAEIPQQPDPLDELAERLRKAFSSSLHSSQWQNVARVSEDHAQEEYRRGRELGQTEGYGEGRRHGLAEGLGITREQADDLRNLVNSVRLSAFAKGKASERWLVTSNNVDVERLTLRGQELDAEVARLIGFIESLVVDSNE